MSPSLITTLLPYMFSPLLNNPAIVSVLLIPLVFIFLDLFTGIIRAVKQKSFSARRIADFCGHDLFELVVVFLTVVLIWVAFGSIEAATVANTLGVSVLTLSTLGSIIENIRDMHLPVPIEQAAEQAVQSIAHIEPSHPPQPGSIDPLLALSALGNPPIHITDAMPAVRAAQKAVDLPTAKIPAIPSNLMQPPDFNKKDLTWGK